MSSEDPKEVAKVDGDDPPALDAPIVPEIVEALRQERIGQINVNILLQRVTEHHEDPDAMIVRTEKMLALAEKYEQSRLKSFRERADAIIDVKLRDPDEVEKRHNNWARRCLKYTVGGMSLVAFGAAVLCVWMGAGVVLTGLFGCSGALGLAMLGPMATGESVSSTDIVRIVTAIRGVAPEGSDARGKAQPQKKRR